MSLLPHEYVRHILDEIDYILDRVSETSYESFLNDPTLKRAFVRSLEIIGEASKKLPDDIKERQPDNDCKYTLILCLHLLPVSMTASFYHTSGHLPWNQDLEHQYGFLDMELDI